MIAEVVLDAEYQIIADHIRETFPWFVVKVTIAARQLDLTALA